MVRPLREGAHAVTLLEVVIWCLLIAVILFLTANLLAMMGAT